MREIACNNSRNIWKNRTIFMQGFGQATIVFFAEEREIREKLCNILNRA